MSGFVLVLLVCVRGVLGGIGGRLPWLYERKEKVRGIKTLVIIEMRYFDHDRGQGFETVTCLIFTCNFYFLF